MRVLERTFRKSERIVARAKFTYMIFLRELIIAAVLGGIIAVLWIFTPQINGLIKKDILSEGILKYVTIAGVGLVILLALFEAIGKWNKEAIITDRKLVARAGVLKLIDVQIPLNQIKSVSVKQNTFQRLLGYGTVQVIYDAVAPLEIRQIVSPLRFAQCITRQKSRYEYEVGNKSFNLVLSSSTTPATKY